MLQFKVRVEKRFNIPAVGLSDSQMRTVGKVAIATIIDRVQNSHQNVFDTGFPPYSDKPIYVRLGKSNGKVMLKAGKFNLVSLNTLRARGVKIIDASKIEGGIKGKFKNAVVKTKNSIRFPDRATYKRYLGHSGLRDLTETGLMLGSIIILAVSGTDAKILVVGYTNSVQEGKARGNIKSAGMWFGISPIDRTRVTNQVAKMVAANLKK